MAYTLDPNFKGAPEVLSAGHHLALIDSVVPTELKGVKGLRVTFSFVDELYSKKENIVTPNEMILWDPAEAVTRKLHDYSYNRLQLFFFACGKELGVTEPDWESFAGTPVMVEVKRDAAGYSKITNCLQPPAEFAVRYGYKNYAFSPR